MGRGPFIILPFCRKSLAKKIPPSTRNVPNSLPAGSRSLPSGGQNNDTTVYR